MSARQARFEIVRTAAGWHARYRAANGQIVFTTESYTRRRAAEDAIKGLITAVTGGWWWKSEGIYYVETPDAGLDGAPTIEVREVDER